MMDHGKHMINVQHTHTHTHTHTHSYTIQVIKMMEGLWVSKSWLVWITFASFPVTVKASLFSYPFPEENDHHSFLTVSIPDQSLITTWTLFQSTLPESQYYNKSS